ncbi:MAG: HlyD family efflux transporter periplasmic adaptor subunit [Fibrobacteraceae bacterium]
MVVDKGRKIFHESWYRIAKERIALRASVRMHRQFYNGILWYVLYEPFTNQYFRLQGPAYQFVARLDLQRTVGDVWNALLEKDPDNAPGQGEVIEILSQLYQANMLQYNMADDGSQLLERKSKKTRKKVGSTLLNIFFLRIPLWDPDSFLKRISAIVNAVISKPAAIVWLLTVGYALKLAIENFDILQDQMQGALAPSNLFLLYVSGVFVKAVHEFGHAAAVRKFGGEVHTFGIMFMLLAPLPYVDATASWSFRDKKARVFVSAAGMLLEFFIAGIAMIVWANVGGGPMKSVAYNVLFIASVSTLLFNINPLMRFDGYYIVTDLLDMPNLGQHATTHLKYLLERYAFKKKDSVPVATNAKEKFIYTIYGFASSVYRILLFTGIVISISKQYLILAAIMAISLVISMILLPAGKFIRYVFTGAELVQVRTRAVGGTLLFLGAAAVALLYIPVPDTFTAPGILESTRYENTINKTRGQVTEIRAKPGDFVNAGDTLMLLRNEELDNEIEETRAAYDESGCLYVRALTEAPADMLPLQKRMDVYGQEIGQKEKEKEGLAVRASVSGVWYSTDAQNFAGKWIPQGDSLGQVIDTNEFQFVAVISQEEASRIFASKANSASVRLHGRAFTDLAVKSIRAIPAAQTELPSEALGWQGGGDIEINRAAGDPKEASEPFYRVEAKFAHKVNGVRFSQGRSGKIHFQLGSTPLAYQGIRKIRQALQKYYRI